MDTPYDEVEDIQREFKQEALRHVDEKTFLEMIDKVKVMALEKLLIRKGLITEEEMRREKALEMLALIEYLKRMPIISPMQREE